MAKFLYSPVKQKILLLLASGLALGLSRSPRTHFRIIKSIPKAWSEIERTTLRRIVREFKHKGWVDFKEEKDGSITVVLTKLGEKHAFRYDPDNISIPKPSRWDRKWRIVIFDIPEKKRPARDALRQEMKKLGFLELQKSVWVFPYECRNAIDFLVELFEIRNHVRYLVVSEMTYDADLRLYFNP